MRFQPFFEEVYVHLFDRTCLLHPAVHASIKMPTYSVIGGIISHAYLVAGVFPDKVAFPCLVAALLGPECTVPDRILQETFISSLSIHEALIVMNALSLRGLTFTNSVKTELMSILSCHATALYFWCNFFFRLVVTHSSFSLRQLYTL